MQGEDDLYSVEEPTIMTDPATFRPRDRRAPGELRPVLLVLSGPSIGEHFPFPEDDDFAYAGRA